MFRRKVMLQQPTHPLARAAPGVELARSYCPGSCGKGLQETRVHGSAQRQPLAAFVSPEHGKRVSQKQLQPPHPTSFLPAHDSVADRQVCSKKQTPSLILSIFLQCDCTREIEK